MEITVPDALLRRLDDINRKEQEYRLASIMRRNADDIRRRMTADLRARRCGELTLSARDVFAWGERFRSAPISKEIWERLGRRRRLPLFAGYFYDGQPCPPDVDSWAVLALEERALQFFERPVFVYEEWSDGARIHEATIADEARLIRETHPDFLADARDHLLGADPWKYLIMALDGSTIAP